MSLIYCLMLGFEPNISLYIVLKSMYWLNPSSVCSRSAVADVSSCIPAVYSGKELSTVQVLVKYFHCMFHHTLTFKRKPYLSPEGSFQMNNYFNRKVVTLNTGYSFVD